MVLNLGLFRRADAALVARLQANLASVPQPESIANVDSATARQSSTPDKPFEECLPPDRLLTPSDRVLLWGRSSGWQPLASHVVATGADVWLLDSSDAAVALALIDAVGITLCDWRVPPTEGAKIFCVERSGEACLPEHIGWLVAGSSGEYPGPCEGHKQPGSSLGYIDQRGWIHVLGETTNTLWLNEMGFPPFEGERWLETHPQVTRAAVLAINEEMAERLGLAVGFFAFAEITAEPSPVLEVELLDHCRRGLAAVKCPQGVIFIASLPRTQSGLPDHTRLWTLLGDDLGVALIL